VSRRVEQRDEGGQGHEQAAQRRVSVPARRPAMARRDAASPPECTCGSCPCRLRINPPGSPVDRHRSKKAWTREPAWLPSGPLSPGDTLKVSRVDAPRRLRPPPLAASLTTARSYPRWLGPRRHAEQQHFSQRPHMVSQPSGHGGCLELPAFGRAMAVGRFGLEQRPP
jgi:hypothetical protein